MTVIEATITVHRADDVTFTVDTDAFLDAIGKVDRRVEDALNKALDAYVDEHAYYHSERWYSLLHERDGHKVLREALATALGLKVREVTSDYRFCTCNWENALSEDLGGTLWDTADGRRWLTIESGDRGLMNTFVGVRAVTCEEPGYAIETASRRITLGCTSCEYSLDTCCDRVSWTDLTRKDDDGWALDGLFCPRCDHPITAATCIEQPNLEAPRCRDAGTVEAAPAFTARDMDAFAARCRVGEEPVTVSEVLDCLINEHDFARRLARSVKLGRTLVIGARPPSGAGCAHRAPGRR